MRTDAGFFTHLYPNDIFDGLAYNGSAAELSGDVEVYCGAVNIVTNFTGYTLVDERTGERKGSGGANEAHYQNNLHGFWINLPTDECTTAGIGAVEHMVRVGAMFVIPADRFDTSTFSKVGDDPAVFYYENYSGGIGVAKKLFDVWRSALEKGMEIAQHCNCRSGCQNCIEPAKSCNISNADIDKLHGTELATKILTATEGSPHATFRNGRMVPL